MKRKTLSLLQDLKVILCFKRLDEFIELYCTKTDILILCRSKTDDIFVFMFSVNPGDYILLDDATDITATTAVVNCMLSPYAFEGDQSGALVYFAQDKNNLIRMTSTRLNGDHLTAELTGLQPNTTYYYCAQALCILSFGLGDWFYSGVKSFTTLPE